LGVWLYMMDLFTPLELDPRLVRRLASEPEKLFELIREEVEWMEGKVKGARLLDTYRDPLTSELLVEYIVEVPNGELSVKVIVSDNLAETLRKYYEYEASKARGRRAPLSVG